MLVSLVLKNFQNTELDEVQKHRTGTGLCD